MMDIEEAKQILSDNFDSDKDNTFTYIMYEKSRFPKEQFWQVYESIECLVKNKVFSRELAEQVTYCYDRFLKEIIYHLDGGRIHILRDLPENFYAYIERFDDIKLRFYRGSCELSDESSFELERYG